MAAPQPFDRNSIYLTLVQFPMVCFTLALLTDIIYWQTAYLMWTDFSAWLLLIGIVMGCVALLFGVIANLLPRNDDAPHIEWAHTGTLLVVLILAFFNNLVHARDGWTSVVPWGLILSALMVLIMLSTPWLTAAMKTNFERHPRKQL
jgi:uncharacterized membrane protein